MPARDPGTQHGNSLSNMISRAGEGPGLQVFPGSVPEVAPVSGTGRGLGCGGLLVDLALLTMA
jgi:hypothetical protein